MFKFFLHVRILCVCACVCVWGGGGGGGSRPPTLLDPPPIYNVMHIIFCPVSITVQLAAIDGHYR